MKTSDDAETGGGAVTTTGGKIDSSGRGEGSCVCGGVSRVFGGVSWAVTAPAVDMPTSKAKPASSRSRAGNRPKGRMNIEGKVIPHDRRLIQYISGPWTRN